MVRVRSHSEATEANAAVGSAGPAPSPGEGGPEGAAAPGQPRELAAGDAEPSFEASAERLAAIVRELESGALSLEQSLRLFEEGIGVARAAQRRLDAAERRVEELLGVDEQGEAVTRPIDQ